ncbi:MAG TPA: RnfABCDGE type electron transport complex subunit D [Blastocatellia bacterium]|nr:RnfABCDGE type electron transport complex subunit D [Blastocatellia bacterium]
MNNDNWSKASRLGGLRRFAVAITVLNILGHTVFGFEQSLAQPLSALVTAYIIELLLEFIDARTTNRPPNYLGGFRNLVDFLLSAHITALAVAMLLYANEAIGPVIFATAVAIGSKCLFRVRIGSGKRHFLNPSNFGITMTLLAFPWVGIAPPYHFTEHLEGVGDWVLPAVIIVSGTFLNARFTKKLPLIAAWLVAFVLQAGLRSVMFDVSFASALLPMTGVAFILFTFYMVTDPATTPTGTKAQILFGAAVAAAYGTLLTAHVVFGLFFGLSIVTALRGLGIYASEFAATRSGSKELSKPAPQVVAVAREVEL